MSDPTTADLLASAEAALAKHRKSCLRCLASEEAAACNDRCPTGPSLQGAVTSLQIALQQEASAERDAEAGAPAYSVAPGDVPE